MAHILFLTPYYPPEVGAPQTRISEMATRLVKRGHEVTVLTTLPNYPSGIVPPEYRRGHRRETRDGVKVVRVWSYTTPNKSFLHRVLGQLSFGLLAAYLGRRAVGKPDVIIVESPPLFNAISGRLLGRWKRAPYIFTVADLWPEAAVQMGVLRNPLLIRLARALEESTYRRAAAISTISAGDRQSLLRRRVPAEKVFVQTNGVDTELIRPVPQAAARAELGWKDTFTVLFAGTLGLAQDLPMLLDAAERLRDFPDIQIVLVGDGAMKGALEADARKRGLDNVTFKPSLPHERMPLVLSAADVCFCSLRKIPLFESAMPSKLYEAMSCARPIVLAADGHAREVTERQAGAAVYAEPGNGAAIAQAILTLRGDPERARVMGERGREFAVAHFDRDLLTAAFESKVMAVMRARRKRPIMVAAVETANRS